MPMQQLRTPTPNNPPTGLLEGQLSVGMGDSPVTLWTGVPTSVDPSGRVQLLPGNFVTSSALTTALGGYLPLTGGTMQGSLALQGVTDGSTAAAGQVGEFLHVIGPASTAVSGSGWDTVQTWQAPPGCWLCWANLSGTFSPNPSNVALKLSPDAAGVASGSNFWISVAGTNMGNGYFQVTPMPHIYAVTTPLYLYAYAGGGGGSWEAARILALRFR